MVQKLNLKLIKNIIFYLWVGKHGNILSVPFFLTFYCKNILSVGWKSWSQTVFFLTNILSSSPQLQFSLYFGMTCFVPGAKFGDVAEDAPCVTKINHDSHVSCQPEFLRDAGLSFFVAGATFGDVAVSRFVASATFGDVAVSHF